MRSYYDSVEGAGRRIKVRLRWYDSSEKIFLEVKQREFDLIAKSRTVIETTVRPEKLPFRRMLMELHEILSPELREVLAAYSRPTVMTRDRRDYFRLMNGDARVTLDSDLTWFDQSGRLAPRQRFGVTLPHTAILEGKVRAGEESRLTRMLRPLRLTVTRFSKYVVGCQQLGLAADTRGAIS